MIIDSHTHIVNMWGGKRDITAEDLNNALDEAGIDAAVVIANFLPEDNPMEIKGITNAAVIEAAAKYPKFKPLVRISYRDIENDIKEVEKYFKDGLAYGIKLYPGYQNFYPGDEKLNPVFELCERYSKPLMVHTGMLLAGSSGFLKQVHPLNIDEVASRYPNLKIVIAHFGNPWVMDCAAVVSKNPNVFADLSGYFTEWQHIKDAEVDDFVADLQKFATFAGGYAKFLFGTDYPLYDQKEYIAAVNRLSMSEEEKELVFWRNAKEIFGI